MNTTLGLRRYGLAWGLLTAKERTVLIGTLEK